MRLPGGAAGRRSARGGWLSRLAGACSRHRWVAVGTVAAAVASVSAEGVSPLVIRVVVDNAVDGATRDLPSLIAALAALAVVSFAAGIVRRYLGGRLSLDVQHDLRRAVFRSAIRFDGAQDDASRTGQVVARVLTDLQQIQGLLSTAPVAVGYVVLIAVSFGAMVWLSPLLSLVAVAVLASASILTARSRRTLFPVNWSAQQRAADIAQHVEETVAGVRVVKGFGQGTREVTEFDERARWLYRERLRAARITSRLAPPLAVLPVLGLVAIFGVGGVLALHGDITVGTFLAFSTYVANLVLPMRVIGGLVVTAQLARAGTERVYDIVDAKPGVTDPAEPTPLPDGPLSVEFDGVTFGYGPGQPVLDGVSFTVKPGETVALVGAAGTGKSTLIQLVPRFYTPQAGQVRVGGVPVPLLSLAELRGAIGTVFDETFLFSDTVGANIGYGRPDATAAEIRHAARVAQADEFIAELPAGYDTPVGDRGSALSGGQRQRVALARALLPDPRILLLDDPASAVDASTEQAIYEQLRTALAGRTTIVVARRRSTLALANRIVVLSAGRVFDIGTEAELERRGSLGAVLSEPGASPAAGAPIVAAPIVAAPAVAAQAVAGPIAPAQPATRPATLWPSEAPRESAFPAGLASAPSVVPSADGSHRDDPVTGGADPKAPGLGLTAWGLARPVRLLVLAAAVLTAADAATTISYPLLARLAIDDGVLERLPAALVAATALGLAIAAADWAVNAAQTRVTARAAESVLYVLRVGSFGHLQRLGLDFYEREQSGRIMTRMTTDVNALSSFLQTGVVQMVTSAATAAGIAVALIVTDPLLAAVALAPALPLAAVTLLLRPRMMRIYGAARELVSAVNTDLQENVAGVRVLQSFVREELSQAKFDARSAAYRAARMRAQRWIAAYFPLVELICDLALVVVLAVGARGVADGTLSAGLLTAFLLYLQLFFTPLQTLSQLFDSYQQARVGFNRIGGLLRVPAEPQVSPGMLPFSVDDGLSGDIELRGVGFRYQGSDRDVLEGVDLRIRAGETVALVGATGAGKSTLVKLLSRFYDPTTGQILVGGVDVRRYPLEEFRRRLGIVPQEPYLFSGDVAANIAYGRPDAAPEQIEEAARAVGALAMVAELPAGFRQRVGGHGQGLSAGQRQLVALARAELVDPDLVLLDEATAALDPATESAVARAASRLTGQDGPGQDGPGVTGRRRTTVLVAHRLATAARADRIVVLDAGHIAQQGTHTELLARDGPYRDLWRAATATPGGTLSAATTSTQS